MMLFKKYIIQKINVITRLVVLLSALLSSFCLYAKDEHAYIIFTAGMSEIGSPDKGNYPQLAYLLKKYRQKEAPTFFIFGGGSIGPSALSSFDRGVHIIDLLNSLEPDVMAVTKRDFSFFEDELSLRSHEAVFPFVLTNIVDKETQQNLDGINNSVIIQQGNYKIGILSVIDTSVIDEYGLKRINIIPPQQALTKQAEKLRQQGIDFIALVYSGNYISLESFIENNTVDFILHKDAYINLSANVIAPKEKNYVLLTQLNQTAVIELTWQKNHPESLVFQWQTVNLSHLAKNPEISKQVNEYKQRLRQLMNERIGLTTTAFNTKRKSVRTQENAFGNLIADAAKTYTNADVALINGGTIRGGVDYPKNHVFTRGDIMKELPFRNKLILTKILGKDILSALEWAVSDINNAKGRFLHVAGMQFSYHPEHNIGQRIAKVTINHQAIDINKYYKVAMTDYLKAGGDGFNMFKQATTQEDNKQLNKLLSTIVIAYFRQYSKLSPKVSGRIVALSQK